MSRRKRQRLGQHFLVDRAVAEAIARLLDDEPDRVLEIGPGRGALTEPLMRRFERVLAVEVDWAIADSLRRRITDDRLDLRVGDALREPLDPLLGDEAPWQVAANLPYSVGTAIVRRLLPRHDLVSRMVVMLQEEVAERLVARPGDRAHGLLALERAAFADAHLARRVPAHAFRPRPRVVSAVVVLDLRPPTHADGELKRALGLASRALTMPRKMVHNAVAGAVDEAELRAAGIDPAARPGTLALDDWVRLVGVVAAATPDPESGG